MENEKLKPCPFCGGEVRVCLDEGILPESDTRAWVEYYCQKCDIRFVFEKRHIAIYKNHENSKDVSEIRYYVSKQWNTRAKGKEKDKKCVHCGEPAIKDFCEKCEKFAWKNTNKA